MGSIRRPSGITYLAIAALLFLAVPGLAQSGRETPAMATPRGWTGSAGVGVEVRDRDGHPLDGAQVQLVFSERGEGGEAVQGPAVVRTDASGRASIRGLAPGEWVLTVRHPKTMAYVAMLQVREGRRPREINASQVKVGESLVSLRVKYFEASGPAEHPVPAMPRPEAAPAPKTAPAPRPEPTPQGEAAPPSRPTQPSQPMAPGSSEMESPAAKEPPAAAAAPSAPTPEAAPAPSAPASQPAPEEAPPEEMPAPTQPSPAPATPSAAEAPAPRRTTLRSAGTGSCPECRPGEWSVTGEGTAAGGEGICPEDLEARIKRAAALLGSSRALGPWAGSIELAGGAVSVLGNQAYGELTTLLRSVLADDAACRALAVLLPAGAAFSGFEMAAADGAEWTQCLPGEDCLGGGWVGDPLLVRTPAGLVVAGAYRNAGTAPRRVRLTVYFTAPEGWAPR